MSSVVSVNKNVQGGIPCFAGTRVPISSLFDHLKLGYTVDYFLEQFSAVKREQVEALLEKSQAMVERDAQLTAP
jgi:uncharacterized protein (DUF433 family)